jgi:pyruvate kinase
MTASQTKITASGPELRGANITLDTIMKKTDVSTRQTKIVCTLGPACWEVEQLESLIDAGLSIARFNFSHGDHEGHKACLDRLRQAADHKKKHVGTFPIERYPPTRRRGGVGVFWPHRQTEIRR